MMKQKEFALIRRLNSFKYAANGLKTLLKEEHNSRFHFVAAIISIAAGFFFGISKFEWVSIIFAIGFVFSMELLNSAIENISDLVSPEKNSFIKKVKDQAAAAVLISAIVSSIIGLIIFVPKIIDLIE